MPEPAHHSRLSQRYEVAVYLDLEPQARNITNDPGYRTNEPRRSWGKGATSFRPCRLLSSLPRCAAPTGAIRKRGHSEWYGAHRKWNMLFARPSQIHRPVYSTKREGDQELYLFHYFTCTHLGDHRQVWNRRPSDRCSNGWYQKSSTWISRADSSFGRDVYV